MEKQTIQNIINQRQINTKSEAKYGNQNKYFIEKKERKKPRTSADQGRPSKES